MLSRRDLLVALSSTGIGTAVFHRAIASLGQRKDITTDMVRNAEWITGIELSEAEREEIVNSVKRTSKQMEDLRQVKLDHSIAPALHFQPLRSQPIAQPISRRAQPTNWTAPLLPEKDEEIAFLPVHELSALIRAGKLTSTRLTQVYLARLKKYGPMLRCVVNLTEELALQQAKKADDEIAAGRYRGPLHGIPWGAKDLIAVDGYPTTWGIPVYKDRVLKDTATVARRLEEAGAVLVAKLSLGAIAMGDQWFEGLTRNPWNAKQGSSGSSAGSASATVAGLVGFSLGSETLGSILSPCRRCGASGHRPTYGRVSRHGCMPLSWSMDKIGPICRSIEDCALVFDAIHGRDGSDATVADYKFQWPSGINVSGLKVGYTKTGKSADEREDLKIIQALGCEIVEVQLPNEIPLWAMTSIIDVEGASVFDELLRKGETDGWNAWKGIFQSAQFISAIDYLRFQRARTKLMQLFEESISGVDILLNTNDLVHTNFTGHPSATIPTSFRGKDVKQPLPTIFTGHLNEDDKVMAIAHAYQMKMDAHLKRPPLDQWLEMYEAGTLDEVPEEKGDESKDSNQQGSKPDNQELKQSKPNDG